MLTLYPTRRLMLLGGALAAVGAGSQALAQTRSRVNFARGNDNAAVDGTVTGNEYRDYLLGARAGQSMSVSIMSERAYFNILPPGSTGEAIYNSSVDGNDAVNVRLPKTGDYTIRVYLLGADEDEGTRMPFTLSITIM